MKKQYIDYYKKLNMFCIIGNSISLICFTILAIVFKIWWIVLFAILFITTINKEKDRETE